MSPRTETFDHTALSDLKCEEKFVRLHRDGLSRPGAVAALQCGIAIHAGVQAYYAGASEGLIVDAVIKGWGRADAQIGTDWRTLALAQRYVAAYMRAYPRPWPFQVLHNEGYIEGAEFTGIPDRAVERALDGLVYAFELKTTAMWLSTGWQEAWAYSQQAAMQVELLEQRLRRLVAGFWMDAVYLSDRKDGPKASDFVRCGPFTYSTALRADILNQVRRDSDRARDLVLGTGEPARPTGLRNGACLSYGRICEFARFCRLDPQDRPDAYELAQATGELVYSKWDPKQRDISP